MAVVLPERENSKCLSLLPTIALDASADLTELGRTPVAVVCAGVKSILDIGRTLEFLETEGVTVATYGQTTDFPAFFTRKSGFQVMENIHHDPSDAWIKYFSNI